MKAAGLLLLATLLTAPAGSSAATSDLVWRADRGDGTYVNPVLFADYSDPDVVRVGGDFYLTASSFSSVPGLPILHSLDLVNWTLISHAAPRLPSPDFDTPQHGKGLWAPSLRHHDGRFWIYVGDPDRGIFVTTARNPRGPWSPLTLVKAALGAIDPCPLWDDDGNVYLVHAWAKSRAGFNSVLTVTPLSRDGLRVSGKDVLVFDGRANHPTIEGPKFHKRNGWYYIFAPAGGVATGWQTVLRSKNILGPYEDRVVLRQGRTEVNGPHQGAWVDTAIGENWFIHFQDRGVYGRVVHLQPMVWKSEWPVIGADPDADGVGEPVPTFRKPAAGPALSVTAPRTSDEFVGPDLGLQWQWNANPSPAWTSLSARPGWLRLESVPGPGSVKSVFDLAAVLMQKAPAEEFRVSTRIDATGLLVGERAGLVVMGRDTAFIAVHRNARGLVVVRSTGKGVDVGGVDVESPATAADSKDLLPEGLVTLGATFERGGRVRFDARSGGVTDSEPGPGFAARQGVWVGARIGMFASGPTGAGAGPGGHVDVDWFRVERLN